MTVMTTPPVPTVKVGLFARVSVDTEEAARTVPVSCIKLTHAQLPVYVVMHRY